MSDPTDNKPTLGRGYYLTTEVNKIFAHENMLDVSEALVLLVSMWAVNLHPTDSAKRDIVLDEFERRVRNMLPIFEQIAKQNV